MATDSAATLPLWLVTIAIGPGRTADRPIRARSQWEAGWLYRSLHPADTVVMVRRARWQP